ncbi:MAG: ribosome maturation factor RimP [Legionellaceae bacterium]|nr:ribosome maturation factor RimP [Legionellaceae bacterium]HCA88825.1 ribosome maturation factor RimP [Legionellales bacterium]|tara:strand:+ start:175 stop:621 length:447 start_codon:yes stop_codon:yes gene_type:complete
MIRNNFVTFLKPIIEELGYQLWGCEYLSQGKHSLLRIYIDNEQGIGITDCEKVSRQVSAVLDVENKIQGEYNLEVSSPGIPKPLFFLEQYKNYIGKEIDIKLYQPLNKKRKIRGVIGRVNEDGLTVLVADDPIELPFASIVKANLVGE